MWTMLSYYRLKIDYSNYKMFCISHGNHKTQNCSSYTTDKGMETKHTLQKMIKSQRKTGRGGQKSKETIQQLGNNQEDSMSKSFTYQYLNIHEPNSSIKRQSGRWMGNKTQEHTAQKRLTAAIWTNIVSKGRDGKRYSM